MRAKAALEARLEAMEHLASEILNDRSESVRAIRLARLVDEFSAILSDPGNRAVIDERPEPMEPNDCVCGAPLATGLHVEDCTKADAERARINEMEMWGPEGRPRWQR